MSTCISRAGEYSGHETTKGNYICDRCGVLDEDGIFAEVERLRKAAKPAVDYCLEETYTLDYSDLETHCVRLVVRDLGIADAELSVLRPRAERAESIARQALARAERAEVTLDAVDDAISSHEYCIGECGCATDAVRAVLDAPTSEARAAADQENPA